MGQHTDIDFFISRSGADKDIALHVSRILKDAGFTTLLQDEDFGPSDFMRQMEIGFESDARMISLLSVSYQESEYCRAEYNHVLGKDPNNINKQLIVFRIEECQPVGSLQNLAYVDMVPHLNDLPAFEDVLLIAVGHKQGSLPDWDSSKADQIRHPSIKNTPNFTGRETELAALKQALWSGDHKAAITQPAAVHGLGGVGKSVLAREYGWVNKDLYAGLWWINAEQEIGIQDGLIALGSRFIPGLSEAQDLDAAANATLDYLATHYADADKPWLIIYDNIESEELFRDYAPRGGVHALVTSRVSNFSNDLVSIPIESWPEDDAVKYLTDESGREFSEDEAKELANTLGCLPLALSHAAAFLKREKYTQVSDYLKEINEWLAEVPKGAIYPDAVFATFGQAITKCEEEAPGVSAILALSVFFAPDSIYLEFFEQSPDLYPEMFQQLVSSKKRLRSAFSALDHYSLIDLNMDERRFSIHRLIQATAKDGLGEETNLWGAAAVRALNAIYPDPTDIKNWGLCDLLNPHTLHINEQVPDDVDEVFSRLLNETALYLKNHAQYKQAEPLYRRALAIHETSLGPDHPTVALRLNNLAELLRTTNRHAEAEPLYRRVIDIFETSLGPDHPNVATGLNNLAALLDATNRHAEAEPLYRRVVEIFETSFGPDHPNVATSMNNLAGLLRATNRHAEAEPLCRRVIDIFETSLGPDHPNVATGLNNLAALLDATNRHAEAEPLYRRALAIDETSFGPNHPDVAIDLNNLAGLLRDTNRHAEAEPLYRRALAIDEASFGPDHPTVATRLNNLAGLLRATNRNAEAEPLYRRALAIFEASLPRGHPSIDTVRANLEACLNRI